MHAPIRIRFDRGTLVFVDVPRGIDLGAIDGVRYDGRVDAWRARASDRDSIVRDLHRRRLDIVDETRRALPGMDGPASIELRPYQRAALDAWIDARRRGVVVLPTGAGKTRLAIAAMLEVRARTLVLVPTRVLMDQWVDELSRQGLGSLGRWGDRRRELGAITVATMDAAWRWMDRLGDAFDLVVVDEVHRVPSELRVEALEMSIAPWRLGLTATLPNAESIVRIERTVGGVVYSATVDELAGRYLAPFDVSVVEVELTKPERDLYREDMSIFRAWADGERFLDPNLSMDQLVRRASRTPEGKAAMDAMRRARRLCTFPTLKRRALAALVEEHRARKVLIFTPDNKTAYRIVRDHLIAPITCDIAKPERARLLDAFRAGTLRALVSSQVLNEGVDVPDADICIVVGGRAGEREHVQRVGRVLRPVPGKRALVYELVVARTSEARSGERRRAGLGGSATSAARGAPCT